MLPFIPLFVSVALVVIVNAIYAKNDHCISAKNNGSIRTLLRNCLTILLPALLLVPSIIHILYSYSLCGSTFSADSLLGYCGVIIAFFSGGYTLYLSKSLENESKFETNKPLFKINTIRNNKDKQIVSLQIINQKSITYFVSELCGLAVDKSINPYCELSVPVSNDQIQKYSKDVIFPHNSEDAGISVFLIVFDPDGYEWGLHFNCAPNGWRQGVSYLKI